MSVAICFRLSLGFARGAAWMGLGECLVRGTASSVCAERGRVTRECACCCLTDQRTRLCCTVSAPHRYRGDMLLLRHYSPYVRPCCLLCLWQATLCCGVARSAACVHGCAFQYLVPTVSGLCEAKLRGSGWVCAWWVLVCFWSSSRVCTLPDHDVAARHPRRIATVVTCCSFDTTGSTYDLAPCCVCGKQRCAVLWCGAICCVCAWRCITIFGADRVWVVRGKLRACGWVCAWFVLVCFWCSGRVCTLPDHDFAARYPRHIDTLATCCSFDTIGSTYDLAACCVCGKQRCTVVWRGLLCGAWVCITTFVSDCVWAVRGKAARVGLGMCLLRACLFLVQRPFVHAA